MAAAGVSLLTACQTIETISMDYMLPAEVSFPEELKRVAVVNNSPVIKPEQTLIEENVITCRSREHHTHAHTIGTEFLDEFDGVGRIT